MNNTEDYQSTLQLKISRLTKKLEQKRKFISTLYKIKENDEWALCGLSNHYYIHPNDPKYQEIEEDKCNLQESCENAKLAITQLLQEELEMKEEIKYFKQKLDQIKNEKK